jgi:hypothetical protein
MRKTSRATIKFLTVLTVFPLAYGLFGGVGMAASAGGSTHMTGVVAAPDRHCC